MVATEGCPLLCVPGNRCPAGRPARPGRTLLSRSTCHALSRSSGWVVYWHDGGLKLQESTFLNELSRSATVSASDGITTYPNWETPLCHALSRSCHAVSRSCHKGISKQNLHKGISKISKQNVHKGISKQNVHKGIFKKNVT